MDKNMLEGSVQGGIQTPMNERNVQAKSTKEATMTYGSKCGMPDKTPASKDAIMGPNRNGK